MEFLSIHRIFVIPILVAVIVQTIKFVYYTFRHGWHPSYIFTHGHMPSAHTAFMVSLVFSVAMFDSDGIRSGAFAIAVILAVIVIDDAVRLRMYMGDQGRYLNMLIKQLPVDKRKFPHFKERLGHRVSEVLVGGLLGALLTIILARLLD